MGIMNHIRLPAMQFEERQPHALQDAVDCGIGTNFEFLSPL